MAVDELSLGSFAEVTSAIHQRPVKDDAVARVLGNESRDGRFSDAPDGSVSCPEHIHLDARLAKVIEVLQMLRPRIADGLQDDCGQGLRLRPIDPVNPLSNERGNGRSRQ